MGDGKRRGVMGEGDEAVPIDPDLDPTDPAGPALRSRSGALRRSAGRAEPDVLAAIAFGGMLGATARFELADALPVTTGHFPWATFWTNLSGSFVLGFLLVCLLERSKPTRLLRPFLATGILGAFTTMSTYQVETARLLEDGHVGIAVIYALGSVASGIGLAYVGVVLGRFTSDRRSQALPWSSSPPP